MNKLIEITQEVNNFLWTNVGLYLILAVGVLMTILTRFFQVTHIKHWFKNTIGSLLKKDSSSNSKTDKKSISQFQALCTALAATVGTGNIAGVSAAICIGGPGAVFWMWIAA
ncbi:MAG: sodium:alanine symporter family protein, partial [Clostridia bacterium]|nr:sodium:alanine symporter family protein [Clostridia bacterium]